MLPAGKGRLVSGKDTLRLVMILSCAIAMALIPIMGILGLCQDIIIEFQLSNSKDITTRKGIFGTIPVNQW